MSIEKMRKNYTMAGLRKKDVDPDPWVQFKNWFHQARQDDLPDWVEVNAMTLSTTDGKGGISSRVVLFKGADEGRLFFYTNYQSVKAQQMAACPTVSLCFFWPHLQRQVRIVGTVEKTDRQRSQQYFATRPRGSQLGAHTSEQSSVVESREVLQQRMDDLEKQYADQEVPCPDDWGGYEVTPEHFEFWQGRESRLHDRICYRHNQDGWTIHRLAP
ncbi:MAG: pyridoxamine 5'-phosphate oxidase [Pirellulaceae bacterium]|nr:pyridoxamine 5'-phosphate oxidase [Pirellulaceae bacterium]